MPDPCLFAAQRRHALRATCDHLTASLERLVPDPAYRHFHACVPRGKVVAKKASATLAPRRLRIRVESRPAPRSIAPGSRVSS